MQAFPRQLSSKASNARRQLPRPNLPAGLSKATLAATRPSHHLFLRAFQPAVCSSHLFLRAFKPAVCLPSNPSNSSNPSNPPAGLPHGLSKATVAATRPSHLFFTALKLCLPAAKRFKPFLQTLPQAFPQQLSQLLLIVFSWLPLSRFFSRQVYAKAMLIKAYSHVCLCHMLVPVMVEAYGFTHRFLHISNTKIGARDTKHWRFLTRHSMFHRSYNFTTDVDVNAIPFRDTSFSTSELWCRPASAILLHPAGFCSTVTGSLKAQVFTMLR